MDAVSPTTRSVSPNAGDIESCAAPDDEPSDPEQDFSSCVNVEHSDVRQCSIEADGWLIRAVKDAYHDITRTLLRLNKTYIEYSHPRTPNYGNHDEPSVVESNASAINVYATTIREMTFGSWLNILLVAVPAGILAYVHGANQVATFALNALAIVPLSSLLTDSTERISMHAGDTVGALVNISLGNLVELILFVALLNGHARIVRESILGSILVNLLPILGCALLAGSMTQTVSDFDTADAQLLVFLLLVSSFALMIPTVFSWTFVHDESTVSETLRMSRFISIVILMIYIVYIIHELSSSHHEDTNDEETGIVAFPRYDQHMPSSENSLPPPRTIRFADEDSETNARRTSNNQFELGAVSSRASTSSDYDAEEQRGRSRTSIYAGPSRRSASLQSLLPRRTHSQSMSIISNMSNISNISYTSSAVSRRPPLNHILRTESSSRYSAEQLPSAASTMAATTLLIMASLTMSLTAQLLVSTIDDLASQTSLTNTFIGLILLPLVGNVAESTTVIAVAGRDKLDLAIAVSIGSAVQIALCVAPVVVLCGWGLGKDVLLLHFNVFEIFVMFGAVVLVVNLLAGKGITNSGLRGALMCACYLMTGFASFFGP